MPENNKKIRFSIGTILAAGGFALAVATMVAGIMGAIYCTKGDLAAIKEEMKDEDSRLRVEATQVKEATKMQDWKIRLVHTQVQNVEKRQIQMNENVTKLMIRFRVQPVDQPVLDALPPPPVSESGTRPGGG